MSTKRAAIIIVSGLLAFYGAANATARQFAPTIGPRDQLKINVFNIGEKEVTYSGTFPVDSDGTFEYPTIGRVRAAGLTTRELETDLQTRLTEKVMKSPQVTVELEATTTKRVLLNGAVRTPGTYQFSGELTLMGALTLAGSLTDLASDEAIIHRPAAPNNPEQTIKVDMYEMFAGGSLQNNISVRDGDVIVIPEAEPVFVTGYVQTRGAVRVKRTTTVLQAVNMAGGITDRGSNGRVSIERLVDGKKIKIDVKEKDLNTALVKPGDMIVVGARIF